MAVQTVTPSSPISLALTGNAAIDGLILKGITALAGALAAWLYTKLNLTNPEYSTYLAGAIGSVLVIGATAVWGWINVRATQAKAVMAGINLVVSGANVTQPIGAGLAISKPVTPTTAQQIVASFGDAHVAVKDEAALTVALNQSQLSKGAQP